MAILPALLELTVFKDILAIFRGLKELAGHINKYIELRSQCHSFEWSDEMEADLAVRRAEAAKALRKLEELEAYKRTVTVVDYKL